MGRNAGRKKSGVARGIFQVGEIRITKLDTSLTDVSGARTIELFR
jgi:hypothetical protein